MPVVQKKIRGMFHEGCVIGDESPEAYDLHSSDEDETTKVTTLDDGAFVVNHDQQDCLFDNIREAMGSSSSQCVPLTRVLAAVSEHKNPMPKVKPVQMEETDSSSDDVAPHMAALARFSRGEMKRPGTDELNSIPLAVKTQAQYAFMFCDCFDFV